MINYTQLWRLYKMHDINFDLELDKFIKKYNLALTKDEKVIIKLAIVHGVIVYNDLYIKKLKDEK